VRAVLKRELGAWVGDMAGVLGVRARWSTAVCGEGGANRGPMAQRESEGAKGTVRHADGLDPWNR
jgi:hypothetical protein